MYLVDTNVVSELRKLERADRNVYIWGEATPSAALYISVISIMEIEIGVRRIERRDKAQGGKLRNWLADQVLIEYSDRILPVDLTSAQLCAGLHVPDPRPERDAMIAATAMAHGLTLVTRNTADFQNMGVPVLNPWMPV